MSTRTTEESKEKETVVDFNGAREKRLTEKRRKTERIFFKQLLEIYSVTGDSSMRPIEIVDVSEDGMSFQIPFKEEAPWPTETDEVPLRVYFSRDTYIPVRVKIQNSRPAIEEGVRYIRYGCTVDKQTATYETYLQFVKFLKLYAENAYKDTGGETLFYL